MTFTDIIAAAVIFGLFAFGFSQAFFPAYNAWERSTKEYRTAQTMSFIAESFKDECAKPDRNIENWEKMIAPAKELESYEIAELRQGDILRALKLTCVISGEHLEIIGLCTP